MKLSPAPGPDCYCVLLTEVKPLKSLLSPVRDQGFHSEPQVRDFIAKVAIITTSNCFVWSSI